MDRLNAAHLRALDLEREHLLEQRYWQRLVNQARREQRTQTKSRGWMHVLEFVSSRFVAAFQRKSSNACKPND
jgi:hypothetical protein